jgi:hypothetical protein
LFSFHVGNQTPAAALQEQILKRYEDALDRGKQHLYSYDCLMKDKDLILQITRFYDLSMSWLIRLADPNNNGCVSMRYFPVNDSREQA